MISVPSGPVLCRDALSSSDGIGLESPHIFHCFFKNMSRSQRLFDLLQHLRCHKYPVSAATLARELSVSVRTVYRDIATLQAQGAEIEGEAGLGYILKPGFTLPPLMFSVDELEALLMGAEWISSQANGEFSVAAQNAIAKISAVLPTELKLQLATETMRVAPGPAAPELQVELADIRKAIRQESVVSMGYTDLNGQVTQRDVWPVVIGFFQQCYLLVAWCEARQAFRHFRVERIQSFTESGRKYPEPRYQLLRRWREAEKIKERASSY